MQRYIIKKIFNMLKEEKDINDMNMFVNILGEYVITFKDGDSNYIISLEEL